MFSAKCAEKGLKWTTHWDMTIEASPGNVARPHPHPLPQEREPASSTPDISKPTRGAVLVLRVRGDEGKLRQVLINLLANAVKFTERGGVILKVGQASRLSSGTATAGDVCDGTATDATESAVRDRRDACPTFWFEVIDTGVGIPGDVQADLFKPFHQGAAGIKIGGTGLGLAIAKRLLALMSGQLEFESEAGKGSRFWFTVPLDVVEADGTSNIQPQTAEFERVTRLAKGCVVKALVVDDVRENREVISQMLTSLGCEVVTAESGERAVEVELAARPDIVFMDIRLPGIDGVEATRRIKASVVSLKWLYI